MGAQGTLYRGTKHMGTLENCWNNTATRVTERNAPLQTKLLKGQSVIPQQSPELENKVYSAVGHSGSAAGLHLLFSKRKYNGS